MANQSIKAAFERMWQHVIARLDNFATEEYVDSAINSGNDTFYAIYGTTTSAEIEEAYQAGKKLYCIKDDGICPLYARYNEQMSCFFRGGFYIYCSADTWTESCPYLTEESLDDVKTFVAVYEETSFDEILAAYNANKPVFLNFRGISRFQLTYNGGTYFHFAGFITGETTLFNIICDQTNGWSFTSISFATSDMIGDTLQIETGAYTGATSAGSGTTKTLTFNFVPKIVHIWCVSDPDYMLKHLWGNTTSYVCNAATVGNSKLNITHNGTTMTIANGESSTKYVPTRVMNDSDYDYRYFAIG